MQPGFCPGRLKRTALSLLAFSVVSEAKSSHGAYEQFRQGNSAASLRVPRTDPQSHHIPGQAHLL